MLVGLNLRDRRVFDMYRVDLTTGADRPRHREPGRRAGLGHRPRLPDPRRAGAEPQGRLDDPARARQPATRPGATCSPWPFGENGGADDFTADGKALYVETSIGADTTRLVKVDVAIGQGAGDHRLGPQGRRRRRDHPSRRRQGRAGGRLQLPEERVDASSIRRSRPTSRRWPRSAAASSTSGRDRADKNWLVTYQVDDGPVAWYVYNRDAKKAELLFVNQPELAKYQLAKMEPVVIKARDGFELVSYLTLPVGGARPRTCRWCSTCTAAPGGATAGATTPRRSGSPTAATPRCRSTSAARPGSARSSSTPATGEWGVGTMQHDLTDAVKWADRQGDRRPEEGLHLRRFLRRLRHPGRARVHARALRLRRRHRRAVQHQDPVRSRSRPTGRRSRSSSSCGSATSRPTRRSTRRSRRCSTPTRCACR